MVEFGCVGVDVSISRSKTNRFDLRTSSRTDRRVPMNCFMPSTNGGHDEVLFQQQRDKIHHYNTGLLSLSLWW